MMPLDRRAVLKLLAAGAAASVAACRAPRETIHPMADQPEGVEPGVVRRYATALPLAGYMRGLTGLVVDGRPIKLEGLAAHPASLGATDLFAETAILDLYDPQRLKTVAGPVGPSNWPELARALSSRTGSGGGERIALLTGRTTSPTLLARIAALQRARPGLRHVRWEPFDDDAVLAGTEVSFGRRLSPRPRLAETDMLLCLGADPLGPGPEQVALAQGWAARRRTGRPARLFVAEASPTATGMMADRRAAAAPHHLAGLCHALHAGLTGGHGGDHLPSELATLLAAALPALASGEGRALVLAGERQPAAIHAFAAWLNARIGAAVDYIVPVDPVGVPHRESIATLARDMHDGRVDTLVILDANPCYAAPPSLRFGEAMARVPLSIVATRFPDETSAAATWSVPLAHPLEGWHDGRAADGTASISQPLVRPFYDTRTSIEIVDLLLDPTVPPNAYGRVRAQWGELTEPAWRTAVAEGIVPGTNATPQPVRTPRLVLPPVPIATPTIDLRPSPTLWDGRGSTNAWAQECPDPITKEVWGTSARMHPADMAALGLGDGDLVRLGAEPTAALPARAIEGQARGVTTVLAGYGRRDSGPIADEIGANGFALAGAPAEQPRKAGGRTIVPTTQHQFALAGELARLFPVVAPGTAVPRPATPPPSLLPNPPARDNAPPQWAMAIDTDLCIGCNACVVACQAENNVPAIGPEEMARGRDMHWLRVDRYAHDGGGGFQPVPCMQCEAAPCEPVCPVEASVHDDQGLNLQVYNRCIGTRTCQANCPYKVRRFNFLDYADADLWGDAEAGSVSAQRNPDVTVRARGVMEKCTYCVQRIEAHNREADAGDTPAPVVTACQAACPTRAISFGPLDGEPIRAARADPRHYALLEELGTKPRTTYLARRRDTGAA